ncbi:hypothetical protein PINS_up021138 [Pythium insidiosum]|nr:hypothetical protein PINS_up005160 [Pythium insidiosum]GLE09474.1 hypothetical protein PINS_up021138 [Pythium insidiosum]
MGVQNLWVLLAPVGRQIEIESLASQVLAVDASIWLTQFVKAMRDDEGNMIKNAHLLGTFHRVAKLLFYRIRPVFVFDGNTPELKRRTVARRRKRQDHQAANLRQTAQRILLNRLKLYREELKKNGGKPVIESAVAPNFVIPGLSSATGKDENEESKKLSENGDDGADVIVLSDDDEVEEETFNTTVSAAPNTRDASANDFEEAGDESKSTEDDDEDVTGEPSLTIDDIDLGSSRLTKVDLDAVFALPPHLQKDMLNRILRDRRQEVRDQFIPLAGNPEAYSLTQITSFLETSKLNRRIENARQKNMQAEMEKVAPTAEVPLIGHGKRIASSSDRFFIYQKADNPRQASQGNEVGNLTSPMDESIVNDASDWRPNEDDDEIFARLHGPRRKRQRFDEDSVPVKRSLTDFSVGSVKEFTEEVGRLHHRKAAVEEARRQYLLRLGEQQEKPLEIEIARKERQEVKATHITSNITAHDRPQDVAITIKDEDAAEFDQKIKLLLGSSGLNVEETTAFSPQKDDPKPGANDSDDDIEWETVPVSGHLDSSASIEADRDVKHLEVVDSPGLAPLPATKSISNKGIEQRHGVSGSGSQPKEGILSQVDTDPLTETAAEAVLIPREDEMDSNTDDLFAALKGEIEDEKAEGDLVAIRQEALKSAIATASNLTQWAAGAVRRALAVHTQDGSLSSPKQPSSAGVPSTVIDLSQDDNVEIQAHQEDAIVPQNAESTSKTFTSSEGDLTHDDDQTLREAIEKSLAEDKLVGAPLASRYLQYSSIEETVDVDAIEQEQVDLKKLRNRQKRDMEGVNDEMVSDVMELLRLFGVPYLVCPMEAEAQCAALEQLGLVDGIITDDSDIFPFGGRKVYKNIFHNQKFVEAFFANDIEKELGFTQDEMISLALLLGSDYTDGIRGIGIVNATEVVAAYPGVDGLREFKEWVLSYDVSDEALRQERKKNQEELDKLPIRDRFNITHSTARRRWDLGEEFPNPIVVQAYKNPQVDRSDARFSWGVPDLPGLREYCTKIFGWDQATTDRVLLPLMEQFANQGVGRQVQTRIDNFFRKYDDNVKFAKIQSKRLRSAVEDKTQTKKKNDKSSAVVAAPRRGGMLKKTKKTTQTLGL